MIKIKAKLDMEAGGFNFRYSCKDSSNIEHLALITELVEEVMKKDGVPLENVLDAVKKLIEMENEGETNE